MKKITPQLGFEVLENRTVPALLLQLDGSGNLTGIFGNGWDDLELEWQATTDEVEVFEDGNSLGIYTVPGNLNVALGNTAAAAPTLVVDFATNAGSMSGSLTISLGNTIGLLDVDLLGSAAVEEIAGNLSFRSGAGISFTDMADVDVAGSASVDPTTSGDLIDITDSDIGGNLFAANSEASYDTGTVGGTLTFRGNEGLPVSFNLGIGATVAGNLGFTNQRASGSALFIGGSVLGNVTMNAGAGSGFYFQSGSVLGSVSYVGGSLTDTFVFSGAFVGGNVTVNLGSGDDIADFEDGPTVLGSAITVLGGNGADVLEVADLTAPGARLSFLGGNGNDTVDFSAAVPILASAYLDGGFGINDYIPNLAPVGFPITIRNFI